MDENEKFMTEPRRNQRYPKRRQEHAYHAAAHAKAGTVAEAGRTAYRAEFERDYGPDLCAGVREIRRAVTVTGPVWRIELASLRWPG
ncbi:MAG: hypothetical protein ABI886_12740 [Betaproteobacteria bacterium]